MFFSFPENSSICRVLSLKEYLARTTPLRHTDTKSMFVSLTKPFKCVTSQTIGRWIKHLMAAASTDISIFKQHGTCSASAAWIGKTEEIYVAQICKTASCSVKSTTFRKFYNIVVLQTEQK